MQSGLGKHEFSGIEWQVLYSWRSISDSLSVHPNEITYKKTKPDSHSELEWTVPNFGAWLGQTASVETRVKVFGDFFFLIFILYWSRVD